MDITIKQLSSKERKIVQSIAKMQIESLTSTLENDCQVDLLLFSIEREIKQDDLILKIREALGVYENLYHNPASFLQLDDDQLSIFKHILNNFVPRKYRKHTHKIWYKLNLKETFIYYPN